MLFVALKHGREGTSRVTEIMARMRISRQKRDQHMAISILERGASIKQTAQKHGLCVGHVTNLLHAYCKQQNPAKYNNGKRSSTKKDWSKCDGGWLWMKWLKVEKRPSHWDSKDLRPTLRFLRANAVSFCHPGGKESP